MPERDLQRLLAALDPRLSDERYVIEGTDSPLLEAGAFALIREAEGITVVRPDPAGDWAHIAIGISSDLSAIGLTAALAKCLADAGISANVVAALHHDHLFVPWERREHALDALKSLSAQAASDRSP